MVQTISLKYAKQNYKKNMNKYGEFSAFENSIITYLLNDEEQRQLYKYIKKITQNKFELYKIGLYITETNKTLKDKEVNI